MQPVILGHEHGITFASSDDDSFNLQGPIAGSVKDAQIRGNAMVLRSALGLNAASRSAKSAAAFMEGTKYLVANMLRSFSKKLEIELMYGQSGYGTVASTAGNVVTITLADYAPGIWSGGENMPVEFRDATLATSRGTASITSVDLDNRTITVDLLPAGVVATDVIFHKGAYGNQMAGMHKIITNTGTLFNISAATYSLWKGNQYNAAGQLSLAKIERAIAQGVSKGLDTDVEVLVNPKTWADLLSEQAALRKFDSSYKSDSAENGFKSIKFYGQNGVISITPSIYVKESHAFIFDRQDFSRVGSTDITFKRPGMEGNFFRELENSAGYELRAYSDQALFCAAPGRQILIYGIVNS